ncbi:MAG: TrkA family potassium uptake protein [Sedimentisphaerales bacterium]|nr:TrkA family potassium uptake protein [Sedimentisphaerales bacterium]
MYVVVIGGGLVGGGLVRLLMDNKHDVVLLERDKEICDALYAETGVIAVHGDGTSVDALKEAGIDKAEVVVATTNSDAVNLAGAVIAHSFDVPQIIVRMRNPSYQNPYRLAGATRIIRVTDLMVNQMMIFIENPKVRRITAIGGGKADVFVVVVPEGARVAGKSIVDITSDSRFPDQCVFVAVFNQDKDEFRIPRGRQIINEHDEVFLISPAEDIKHVVDLLTEKAQ